MKHLPPPLAASITAACLCLVLASGGASAAASPDSQAQRATGPASALIDTLASLPDADTGTGTGTGKAGPWWMAFDDATLNLLVHAAQQREAGLATLRPSAMPGESGAELERDLVRRQVVGSYVGARVLSVRWLALNGLRDAAERQLQLLQAAPAPAAGLRASAEHAATLASLRQRSERVQAQQQALADQRQALLKTLAELCGLPADDLGDQLAPALSQTRLPAFGSAVPPRLPLNIVRARPDVAAAEAAVLRSLRSSGGSASLHSLVARMQQPEGWIEADQVIIDPSTQRPSADMPHAAADTPLLDEWRHRVDQAAQEVAHDLRALSDTARAQNEGAQRADLSRQAFVHARDQLKAGQGSELQVLEHYQELLAESDRHAAASGELAMAWVRLVASTGASEHVLRR